MKTNFAIKLTMISALVMTVVCLLHPVHSYAAPFSKFFSYTQPDGTQLTLFGEGDEFQAVFETTNGYTVVFEPNTRTYYYARRMADGKRLVSMGVPAQFPVPPGLAPHLRADRETVQANARARQQRWDAEMAMAKRWARLKTLTLGTPAPAGALPAPPAVPTLGTKVGLTLLIDFSDAPATISRDEINAFCNGDSYNSFGNNGSVKTYFSDMSAGRLIYSNIVTIYVRMNQPKSYYNDTSKDNGTQARLLITDALTILKARSDYASTILPTFSSLNTDGSGHVVAFNVFFAGSDSGVWAFGLWPHSWNLAAPITLGNGKSVYAYEISNIGTALELGTFCHENGHMLCDFPDVYDYDYDSVGGAGAFCLMNSGGHGPNPVQVCAYLKLAAGWVTPIDLDSSSSLIAPLVAAPSAGYDQVYRYRRPGVTTEYFLLENRERMGRDAIIPASGIALWHIDELGDKDNQNLTPNAYHLNYEVTLVQADNRWDFENNRNVGDANDLYYQGNSSAGYVNTMNDASVPNAHWWDGSVSGLSLDNFSVAGGTMTFHVGAVIIELPVPVLSGEPMITPGTTNTISWTPGFSEVKPMVSSQGGEWTESMEVWLDVAEPATATAVLPQQQQAGATVEEQPQSEHLIQPDPHLAMQDLFTETFEGVFPGSNWLLTGTPTWSDTSYDAHGGSWSGWCAASVEWPEEGYVDNMNAWMVYGPFSLADATNAAVNFWYKNYSETSCDYFGWYVSTDDINFYGLRVTGNQNSWREQTFYLTNVYTLGNLCGKNEVWLAFIFTSDSSIAGTYGYTGAFVDDISLRKDDTTTSQLQYNVECANCSDFSAPMSSGWLRQTQYTFNNLQLGQTYWYRVQAGQGGQTSAWSNVEFSLQGSPRFTGITALGGNSYCLRATTLPCQIHVLQVSTNLLDWLDVMSSLSDTNGLCEFTDVLGIQCPVRFYRLKF